MKSSTGPPTFAEHNLSDQASTTNRLGKKIRSQAAQLADLTERLIQQEAYSRLVETRLLELDPSHGLPVTPQLLERTGGSRDDRSATGLRRSARSQSTVCGRCGSNGNNSPVYQREGEIRELRRGNETAQERLRDAAQLIRQLREALKTRDNEAKAAVIRARNFQRQANDLRRKLSTDCGGTGARTAAGNQEFVTGRTSLYTAPTSASRGLSGGRVNARRGDKQGSSRQELEELAAEKNALLDYIQEQRGRIDCLETMSEGLEKERTEISKRLEHLKGATQAAEKMRQTICDKDKDIADARKQLEEFQRRGGKDRSEKEEMGRLYNELLEQLKAAGEENERLESKAREAARREEVEEEAADGLREQLDRCLRRFSDLEREAEDKVRHAKEEASALNDALAGAESRLSQVETLEGDVVARGEELERCRVEMDLQEQEIRKERDRTQHLVGVIGEQETQTAVIKARETAAVSRGKELEKALFAMESKVEELENLCEELQKRLVDVRSGREVDGLRRRLAAASELAERQDELLEETSARLETLQNECRHFRGELDRAEERLRNAKKVLEPVVAAARSHLLLERPENYTSTCDCSRPSHRWTFDSKNVQNDYGQDGACDCDSGRLPADSMRSGQVLPCGERAAGCCREATPVNDLAQAAAEALSTLLQEGAADGTSQGRQEHSKDNNTSGRNSHAHIRSMCHDDRRGEAPPSHTLHTSDATKALDKISVEPSHRKVPQNVVAGCGASRGDSSNELRGSRRGFVSSNSVAAAALRSELFAVSDSNELRHDVPWERGGTHECDRLGRGAGKAGDTIDDPRVRGIAGGSYRCPEPDTSNTDSSSSVANRTSEGVPFQRGGGNGHSSTAGNSGASSRFQRGKVSFQASLTSPHNPDIPTMGSITARHLTPPRGKIASEERNRGPGSRELPTLLSSATGSGIRTDPESVRRMEYIRRGKGSAEKVERESWREAKSGVLGARASGAAGVRQGDFETLRSSFHSGSSYPAAATAKPPKASTAASVDNTCCSFGSSSPGAAKIHQRIRDAQATLRALRCAG